MRFKGKKFLSDFWLENYCDKVCTLCGNSGVIDTRGTAISGSGYRAGRLNWCVCPNGRAMKEGSGKPVPDTPE